MTLLAPVRESGSVLYSCYYKGYRLFCLSAVLFTRPCELALLFLTAECHFFLGRECGRVGRERQEKGEPHAPELVFRGALTKSSHFCKRD